MLTEEEKKTWIDAGNTGAQKITNPTTPITIGTPGNTTGTGNTSTSTTNKTTLVTNDQLKVPNLNKDFSLFKAPAASLDKAQSYYNTVMKGKDFTSQRLSNQFMEANAAQSAAAKGAAAQQAALSGATANSQSLLNRMTQRDIEGQRQQGANELSANLGQRADQAAGALTGIGQYKSNYEMQAKQNENQAKQAETALGINLKELEMKVDSVDKQENLDNFKMVLETVDLTTDEGMKKALEAGKKAGLDLDWNAMKKKQWDLKEDKANKELLTYINTNISNYKNTSGSYDPKVALTDPKVKEMMLDLWEAEFGGTTGDLVPKDADGNPDWSQLDENDMKWINSKLGSAMITDKEQAANDFVASMNVYKNTAAYKGMTPEQQKDYDAKVADIAAMMQTGLDVKIENGQVVIKDPATGTVVGAGAVWDKAGGKYTALGNTVTLTNKDGSTVEFEKDADGNWESITTTSKVLPLVDNALSQVDNMAVGGRYGYYTKKDANTLEYQPRGATEPTIYKKGADGKWTSTSETISKATDEQKAFVEQAMGKPKTDSTTPIGVKIPTGTQSGQAFSNGTNYFVNDGGTAVPINFNDPSTGQMTAILTLANDAKALPYVTTAIKNSKSPMTTTQKVQVGDLVMSGKIDPSKLSEDAMKNAGIATLKTGGNNVSQQYIPFYETATKGSAVMFDGVPYKFDSVAKATDGEAQAAGYHNGVKDDMAVFRLIDSKGNIVKVWLNSEQTKKLG